MCVILHMSVITQYGGTALMEAAFCGETEVVVELVKAVEPAEYSMSLPNYT